MFLIFRFLVNTSGGDVANVSLDCGRGSGPGYGFAGQCMTGHGSCGLCGQSKEAPSELGGLRAGVGRVEALRETNKSGCLQVREPCKNGHGN